MYLIPLTTHPNQTFRCTIPIDGENRSLQFTLRYIEQAGYWLLSLADGNTGVPLVDNLPVLTGEYPAANLLEQYGYLKIGSAVVVPAGFGNSKLEPNDQTLGTDFVLVWGDTIG